MDVQACLSKSSRVWHPGKPSLLIYCTVSLSTSHAHLLLVAIQHVQQQGCADGSLLLCCSCISMIHLELAHMTASRCADGSNHTCVSITLWCLVSSMNMAIRNLTSSIRHRLTHSDLSANFNSTYYLSE